MMRCFRYGVDGVLVGCDDMGERFIERKPSPRTAADFIEPLIYTKAERRAEARKNARPHRFLARRVPREKPIEERDVFATETAYARHIVAIHPTTRERVWLYLRLGEPVRQAYLDDIARELRR